MIFRIKAQSLMALAKAPSLMVSGIALSTLLACGDPAVNVDANATHSMGKEETALDSVPQEVLAVALATRPDLNVSEVEYERRDGRDYYDVGGELPDGSEIELDMTQVDGAWTVVEVQRDLVLSQVPSKVRDVLDVAMADWTPTRIIESDQGEGVIIYEFFTNQGTPESVKKEIKWQGNEAQMLTDEWLH